MRPPPPRLSNCYIPQQPLLHPINNKEIVNDDDNSLLLQRKRHILSQRRIETIHKNDRTLTTGNTTTTDIASSSGQYQRQTHELRQLRLESNVIPSSSSSSLPVTTTTTTTPISGSSMIELGRTKVVCTVMGPVDVTSAAVLSTSPSQSSSPIQVTVSYLTNHASFPIHHLPNNNYNTNNNNSSNSNLQPRNNTTDSASAQSQQQQQNSNTYTNQLNPKQCQKFLQEREHDLSIRIHRAISHSIPMPHYYPHCILYIQFHIWYDDDACIIPTCITAAQIALCHANIELDQIVTASTVAIVSLPRPLISSSSSSRHPQHQPQQHDNDDDTVQLVVLADPTMDEMSIADRIITIAAVGAGISNRSSNSRRTTTDTDHCCDEDDEIEITLWEQQQLRPPHRSSSISISDTTAITAAAIDLCFDGCRTMHQFIRQHLLQVNDVGEE